MKKLIESTSFAGDKLHIYSHGLDFEIEINGKSHGVFLTPAAAIASAQKYITEQLEGKKKCS